ncbi:MAG: sugar ABC transporter ATP-binding protein [Janthinobacterium lividum]
MSSAAVLAPETSAVPPDDGRLLFEVAGVVKKFPGVVALDNVSFKLRAGTVHALMGENGAGKSTLMKIIAGLYVPDTGELKLKGNPIRLTGPLDALNNGIAMIHQELNLMGSMTVAENIWIGREPRRFGFIAHDELRRRTQSLFDALKIDLNPQTKVGTLSIANRQMVEIAKAVSFNSDVLIMDEPTSALTEHEVGHLFRIIRDLKSRGKGIVYITHKMNELYEIADEVSVFRDGKFIDTRLTKDITRDQIIQLMVGREVTQMFPKMEVPITDVVLKVEKLEVAGIFRDVSFEVRAGEILGFAGLVGSGRSNLAEALFGVVPATKGSITIDGKQVKVGSPTIAMRHGMAFLTEDRKETGCFLKLDVLANMDSAALSQGNYLKAGFVQRARLERDCKEMAKSLRIKTPTLGETIENLSGGNQQKALIGRWLLTKPRILILDEPTRGIDVGAKAEIHRLVSELAGKGVAVILISSELPEVLGMSDRVLVMHEGRVTGILNRSQADQVTVMNLASQ